MLLDDIKNVSFALCHSCKDQFKVSPATTQILLGTGMDSPDPGRFRKDAVEREKELRSMLDDGTKTAVIVTGMGGEVENGAAPVVARICKGLGMLTLGVLTIPFKFEGDKKFNAALEGVLEMAGHADTLFILNDESLYETHPGMDAPDAFSIAEKTLCELVRNIADIIGVPGTANLDFNEVRSVLKDGGIGFMGIGYNKDNVGYAIKEALGSPLLNDIDPYRSKKVVINVTVSDDDYTEAKRMEDMEDINYRLATFSDDVETLWSLALNPGLDRHAKATLLCTGFDLLDVHPLMRFLLDQRYMSPMDEDQICGLIEKLRKSELNRKVWFTWEEVFESMMRHPEKVSILYERCPECGENLIELFFSTPPRTWAGLCGWAGDMLICPGCGAQKHFNLLFMN